MHREFPCDNADDGCPNSTSTSGLCDECRDANHAGRPSPAFVRHLTDFIEDNDEVLRRLAQGPPA